MWREGKEMEAAKKEGGDYVWACTVQWLPHAAGHTMQDHMICTRSHDHQQGSHDLTCVTEFFS